MRYRMLLWPHANARYQTETVHLARAELQLTLNRVAPGAVIAADDAWGMPWLTVDAEGAQDSDLIRVLCGHSLIYGLFGEEDGQLRPIGGRRPARVGHDLPAILKYKGKTNEMFLHLLINTALYSSDYWPQADGRLVMLDPMCGRGTGLFVAANMGWDAVGADVDGGDLKEAERYFRRYLEYHRFKHHITRQSRTLGGGRAAALCRFEYAANGHSYREGATQALSLVNLDAAMVCAGLGKNAFHIIACDLPYGVHHDAKLAKGVSRQGNWLETLMARALGEWYAALKPGGSVAVSFNGQNFDIEALRARMEQSGFEVLRGGAYEGFSHWVEQAITRNIAVGRKP